jgi:hypothetical protein
MERVTGIEPALSAWESDRSGPLTAMTWAPNAPLVTVIDPATPRLMARQWPVASRSGSGDLSGTRHPHCAVDWRQPEAVWLLYFVLHLPIHALLAMGRVEIAA